MDKRFPNIIEQHRDPSAFLERLEKESIQSFDFPKRLSIVWTLLEKIGVIDAPFSVIS